MTVQRTPRLTFTYPQWEVIMSALTHATDDGYLLPYERQIAESVKECIAANVFSKS